MENGESPKSPFELSEKKIALLSEAIQAEIDKLNASLFGSKENFEAFGQILEKARKEVQTLKDRQNANFTRFIRRFEGYLKARGFVVPDSFDDFWTWFVSSGRIRKTNLQNEPISEKIFLEFTKSFTEEWEKFLETLKEQIDSGENSTRTNLPHSQTVIALIYAYENWPIDQSNKDDIAKKFGYNKANSGHKIYQLYNKHRAVNDRTGEQKDETPRKLKNWIKTIESVLPHLSEKAKAKAEDEIRILRARI